MTRKRRILVIFAVGMALLSVAVHAGDYMGESVLIQSENNAIKWIAEKTLLFKDELSPSRYSVANLNDSDVNTAWVTRLEKTGVVWLKIIFEKPVYVKSFSLRNGYQKSKNLFLDNARVKQLNVEKIIIGGKHSYPLDTTFSIDDTMSIQEFSLEKDWTQSVNLFKTQELRIDISDIYNGRKYQDLCISELNIRYSNTLSYTPSISWQELRQKIELHKTKQKEGWDWPGLLENKYQLFNDLLFYVLTGNEEAYQYFKTYVPEGVSMSAAMNSLYRNAVTESLDNM